MRFIMILCLMVGYTAHAQISKLNYKWVCGVLYSNVVAYDGSKMVFEKYIDTATGNTKYYFTNASSNICDKNGGLLLASTSFNVLDSNMNYLDGLDSIGGREYIKYYQGVSLVPQSSLFLPMDSGIYYFVYSSVTDSVFINEWINGTTDAYFNVVGYCKLDMKQNGGNGKAIAREVSLLPDTVKLSKTQMMACRHANGKDWWVFKQARGVNRVHRLLFTQDSVINIGMQAFTEPIFSIYDQGGQSMFSQQGDRYATTCRGTGKIFVSDFDRCAGELSNPMVYDVPELPTHNPMDSTEKEKFSEGLAFSPNGRFVYVNMYFNIQQLDLWDTNPNTQWSVVAGLDTTWDYFQNYFTSYLGPDNKLYVGNRNGLSNAMSYFDNPDAKGLASNFCKRCLKMPSWGVTTPPNMPNYGLGAEPCWPVGTMELEVENHEVIVYPNPSSSKIYIKNTEPRSIKELYNSIGQLILTSNEDEIDVSRLAKGVYYLRCAEQSAKVVVE